MLDGFLAPFPARYRGRDIKRFASDVSFLHGQAPSYPKIILVQYLVLCS